MPSIFTFPFLLLAIALLLLFFIRIRIVAVALSFIDILVGLLIMGIAGVKTVNLSVWSIPYSTAFYIGVALVLKGVYCAVLSRR